MCKDYYRKFLHNQITLEFFSTNPLKKSLYSSPTYCVELVIVFTDFGQKRAMSS